MGDFSKSQTPNFYSVLGIPKSSSITDICKAYRSCVKKWHPDRNPFNKIEAEVMFTSINQAYQALSIKKREEAYSFNEDQETRTPMKKKSSHNKKNGENKEVEEEEWHISKPILLSRTTSRISPMQSPHLSKSTSSKRSSMLPPLDFFTTTYATQLSATSTPTTPTTPPTPTTCNEPSFPSRTSSRKTTTPIVFSQSITRRKPQPIEKRIECTLEELCHGCVKKIRITRDAITVDGLIVKEEEILMINVKPGWRKGTKITFEGKGDERPGTLPADIIFIIDEKRHPIFKREGDDLELGVEVPLVQALTGCTIHVPLLGEGQITLFIDDIIFPEYEKRIPGQGMSKSNEGDRRGDLKLKFLVEFPTELSDEQCSEIVDILEECS